MKFFLDNCISPRFAQALQILSEVKGHEIVHLRDKFPQDTKDVVWLRSLGAEGGWVVVSGDSRISRGKAERSAWQESGLTVFFLPAGWLRRSYWNQAADIVACWQKITEKARDARPGSGFVAAGKDFKQIYPSQ